MSSFSLYNAGCFDYDKCYLPTWKKTEDCTTYRCRGKTRSFSIVNTGTLTMIRPGSRILVKYLSFPVIFLKNIPVKHFILFLFETLIVQCLHGVTYSSRNNPTYFVCNISNCLFYFVDPHSSHFGMTIPGGRMPPVSHGVRLGLVYDPKPHSPSGYHSSIAEYVYCGKFSESLYALILFALLTSNFSLYIQYPYILPIIWFITKGT